VSDATDYSVSGRFSVRLLISPENDFGSLT
jgi:hypothetical protein